MGRRGEGRKRILNHLESFFLLLLLLFVCLFVCLFVFVFFFVVVSFFVCLFLCLFLCFFVCLLLFLAFFFWFCFCFFVVVGFFFRLTVLGRGLIFQPVLFACTYKNDAIITLQKKSTLQMSIKVCIHKN